MNLRPYQNEIKENILTYLQNKVVCCVSLATGGGKTYTFVALAIELTGNTLILVNRVELIEQTVDSFKNGGINPAVIISTVKKIPYAEYAVGMVQTIQSRYKRKKFDFDYYDNIIIDECHRLDYTVTLEVFTGNIIGFTATPLIEKKITFTNKIGQKISKKIPLAKYYKHLIEGADIDYLIQNNYLVTEQAYQLKTFSKSGLKIDNKTGDYTSESLTNKFDNQNAYNELNTIFEKKCKGLKTIIFNPSTKVNEKVFIKLHQQGYSVKMYDSVNNTTSERINTVEWFRQTPGAILCNVNVFTTGFDVKEVEAIILNRSTTSLGLFIQMSGRGGRITDLIYKPHFLLIDLGGNIQEHGYWSDKRNWKELFSDDSERIINESLNAKDAYQCQECGNFISPSAIICPDCGAEQKRKEKGAKRLKESEIIRTKKTTPNTEKLILYAEKNGLDLLDAKKIYFKSIVNMFEDTPVEVFIKHKASGRLIMKIRKIFKKDYFLFQRSKLAGNRRRKLETFYKQIEIKIGEYYKI